MKNVCHLKGTTNVWFLCLSVEWGYLYVLVTNAAASRRMQLPCVVELSSGTLFLQGIILNVLILTESGYELIYLKRLDGL